MKKLSIALILILCFVSATVFTACDSTSYEYAPLPVSVRYLTNIPGESVSLASGREAIVEDALFATQSAETGEIITPPANMPTRAGYLFVGWSESKDEKNHPLFDFSKPITGSVNLYAAWERDSGSSSALDYKEPTITFQSLEAKMVDDEAETDFELLAVCNQKIVDGVVDLYTAAVNRLVSNKADVREYLTYTRKSSTIVKSAVYEEGSVTVTYTVGGVDNKVTVAVNDVTAAHTFTDIKGTSMDEGSFETKALRYETTDFASYNVIMGGSSSMENWSTSVEDMDPATTKNVGIGGSSAEFWADSLADRLIIPFSPRAVILYVGINDIINYGYSATQTTKNLKKLFDHIHECLPDTQIYFILINYVPGYKIKHSAIKTVNKNIIEYAEENSDFMNIIDAGKVLQKKVSTEKNIVYSEAYFLNDGLHMTVAGYELWGKEVKTAFINREKELYK